MRVLRVLLAAFVISACGAGSGSLFRQYEYEEEMYLSLDGSATMYVNSSIQALNALRGTAFDPRPTARIDRAAVRRYFTTPATRVTRVSTSRRQGRQFVHVRLETDDVRALGATPPFSWSSYRLRDTGGLVVFEQEVGATASEGPAPEVHSGWAGDELVAFRVHIPSVVEYHNAGPDNLRRGNILVWEQPLAARLRGEALEMEARMQPQSILYRTLILFGTMFVAVAVLFAAIIWWVVRRGRGVSDG